MKDSNELTPWFPAEAKPVRIGVFQVKAGGWSSGRKAYSYWDGRRFNAIYSDPRWAFEERKFDGAGRFVTSWRGLAKKPKGA